MGGWGWGIYKAIMVCVYRAGGQMVGCVLLDAEGRRGRRGRTGGEGVNEGADEGTVR